MNIIKAIENISRDSDKIKTIQSMLPFVNKICCNDLVQILRKFVLDSDKVKTISVLIDKLDDVTDVSVIINCIGYDSEKNKAIETLIKKIMNISVDDIALIINNIGYDSEKNKAIETLIKKTMNVRADDIALIINNIDYDSEKNKAIETLIKKTMNVSADDIALIINNIDYDSEKNKAIATLSHCVRDVSTDGIIKIITKIRYNSEKKRAIEVLVNHLKNVTVSDITRIIDCFGYEESEKIKIIEIFCSRLNVSATLSDIKQIIVTFTDANKLKLLYYFKMDNIDGLKLLSSDSAKYTYCCNNIQINNLDDLSEVINYFNGGYVSELTKKYKLGQYEWTQLINSSENMINSKILIKELIAQLMIHDYSVASICKLLTPIQNHDNKYYLIKQLRKLMMLTDVTSISTFFPHIVDDASNNYDCVFKLVMLFAEKIGILSHEKFAGLLSEINNAECVGKLKAIFCANNCYVDDVDSDSDNDSDDDPDNYLTAHEEQLLNRYDNCRIIGSGTIIIGGVNIGDLQKKKRRLSERNSKPKEKKKIMIIPSFADEISTDGTDGRMVCAICEENMKKITLGCGHRFCRQCLVNIFQEDNKEKLCPYCKMCITTIVKTFD
jgi:Mor family transcriptional regulator